LLLDPAFSNLFDKNMNINFELPEQNQIEKS